MPRWTDFRVICGGSWYYSFTTHVRAAFRLDFKPTGRSDIFGFRAHLLSGRQKR